MVLFEVAPVKIDKVHQEEEVDTKFIQVAQAGADAPVLTSFDEGPVPVEGERGDEFEGDCGGEDGGAEHVSSGDDGDLLDELINFHFFFLKTEGLIISFVYVCIDLIERQKALLEH